MLIVCEDTDNGMEFNDLSVETQTIACSMIVCGDTNNGMLIVCEDTDNGTDKINMLTF